MPKLGPTPEQLGTAADVASSGTAAAGSPTPASEVQAWLWHCDDGKPAVTLQPPAFAGTPPTVAFTSLESLHDKQAAGLQPCRWATRWLLVSLQQLGRAQVSAQLCSAPAESA